MMVWQGESSQAPSGDTIDPISPNRASSENGTSKPAKKTRRKGSEVASRNHRRKLTKICQLNLDVLFLIAAYIRPVDLLNLARTCRSLQELLMDASSTFVWKAARQQAKGLPECPADLSEPEYANLMYLARCHGCAKYTKTIFWTIRRRYCPSCRIKRLRRLSDCAEVVRRNRAVVPVEYIEVNTEYNAWCDRDQVASFMHEYRRTSKKKQFISERRSQCRAIRQHARKCVIWQAEEASDRKQESFKHRLERIQRVLHFFEGHGKNMAKSLRRGALFCPGYATLG